MESLLLQIFSQNGIIAMLFVASFFAFIYKGLPFMVKKFDEVLTTFKEMQNAQHLFFKEELQKISSTFISHVDNSRTWNESHDRKLDEIRNIVSKQ